MLSLFCIAKDSYKTMEKFLKDTVLHACSYSFAIIIFTLIIVACSADGGKYPKSIIANIPKEAPVLPAEVNFDPNNFEHAVDVYFDDDTVMLSNLPHGVTAAIDGANVSIRSIAGGVEYLLHGNSDDASFTLNSDKSSLVTFMNLRLFSRNRAAVDVASPEITFLHCMGNAINYLMDGVPGDTSATQKKAAAVSVNGSAVFCGNGKLALRGERKAAVRATGTLVVDGANISVEMARADGLVADSGMVVKSGNMHITSCKDALKSKAGSVVLLGGNMVLNGVGRKGDAVQARNIIIYDGHLSARVAGDASRGLNSKGSVFLLGGILDVEASGNAIYSAKKNDYTSGACIKAETHFYMGGGYASLNNSGVAGKGVNCNGQLQIDGGMLLVCNRGNDVVHEYDRNAHASAKGIKCDSTMLINGGTIEVLVFGKGERCEGIEAKYDMTIGGDDTDIYVYSYDDAINSGGNLQVNGGRIYAYSVANDAVDSNAGIAISGGVLIANGAHSPEQGIDTDYEREFSITGGTVVSVGGAMGPAPCLPKSTHTKQAVFAMGHGSLLRNQYATLLDEEGKILLSYQLPRTINGGAFLVSIPHIKVGESYSFVVADTLSGGVNSGYGLFSSGSVDGNAEYSWKQTGLLAVASFDGNIVNINPDTIKNMRGMMPPPAGFPGGDIPGHQHPKGDFPPPGAPDGYMPPPPFGNFPPQGEGGMLPPPPFAGEQPDSLRPMFMQRGASEEYGPGNLPGK